jgi:F0F1-type ATP synthase assembly protein I
MKPLLSKIRSTPAPYADHATNNGLLGRGMDMALALLAFLLLGWAIDNWLGTKPLFIIVLATLALIGGGARIKYSYDESMRRHEQARAADTRPGGTR